MEATLINYKVTQSMPLPFEYIKDIHYCKKSMTGSDSMILSQVCVNPIKKNLFEQCEQFMREKRNTNVGYCESSFRKSTWSMWD